MAVILDLKGLKCPLPVLRTGKALRNSPPGEQIVVICTDPLASLDIPNLLRETGDRLEAEEREEGLLTFHIRKKRD
jgi:tRNA 2-thiouridine synthesizing protein A